MCHLLSISIVSNFNILTNLNALAVRQDCNLILMFYGVIFYSVVQIRLKDLRPITVYHFFFFLFFQLHILFHIFSMHALSLFLVAFKLNSCFGLLVCYLKVTPSGFMLLRIIVIDLFYLPVRPSPAISYFLQLYFRKRSIFMKLSTSFQPLVVDY